MKDRFGKIFYIGKAINLKLRVRSYFTGGDTRAFVFWLKDILYALETIVVHNEQEALLLEQVLIRQHQPRFNVVLKDDKNHLLLRLKKPHNLPDAPLHLRYPKLEFVRHVQKDDAHYFGPFPIASSIRTTLRTIQKHFHLRTCKDRIIDHRARPCIQYQMGRCPAPCVYEVPEYAQEVQNVFDFLSGHTKEIEKRLLKNMKAHAQVENFEHAAKIRDQYQALKTSFESQFIRNVRRQENQDAIAAVREGPLLEIVRFIIRKGVGLYTFHYSFNDQEFPTEELFCSFLMQLYQNLPLEDIPTTVLVSHGAPQELKLISQALKTRINRLVRIIHPQRDPLKSLLEIAHKNAQNQMQERLKRKETRQDVLEEIQKLLGLSHIPVLMECMDISLFQGSYATASSVCFRDGAPDKSGYRRYHIKTVLGTDDFASIYEVVTRRLKRALVEKNLPHLLIIDGGQGQLGAALAACKDLHVEVSRNSFYVIAMAKARVLKSDTKEGPLEKSSERLFIPFVKDPLMLKPYTAARYFFERIRDEAHRFALSSHQHLRKKNIISSQLDHIPQLGPKRRKLLLQHFGSFQNISKASLEELAQVKGIGQKFAQHIDGFLRKPPTLST